MAVWLCGRSAFSARLSPSLWDCASKDGFSVRDSFLRLEERAPWCGVKLTPSASPSTPCAKLGLTGIAFWKWYQTGARPRSPDIAKSTNKGLLFLSFTSEMQQQAAYQEDISLFRIVTASRFLLLKQSSVPASRGRDDTNLGDKEEYWWDSARRTVKCPKPETWRKKFRARFL